MNEASFSFRPTNTDLGSQELTEEYIRERAYQIYEQHGRQDGHDKDDWYQAEAEIIGKKPATGGGQRESLPRFASAA